MKVTLSVVGTFPVIMHIWLAYYSYFSYLQ